MTTHHSARPDEELFAFLKHYGRCDLLLDRTLGDPLRQAVAAETFAEPAALLNPDASQVEPDACPILFRLTADNFRLLHASVEVALAFANADAAAGRPVCAWMFGAEGSLQAVASRLRRQMIVRGPGWKKFLLRFYDPRVMPWLHQILSAEQLGRMLHSFDWWVWMKRDGRLQTTSVAGAADAGFVDITAEQDAALDRVELLNQCVATLIRTGIDWPVAQDAQLVQWLTQAIDKGHVEQQDQLAYLLHAALVHPRFDTEPRVAQAIAAARREGLGLCAALGEFDDEVWRAIRESMNAGPALTNNDKRTSKQWPTAS
jgi:Domain of unknown function (DUF4123)